MTRFRLLSRDRCRLLLSALVVLGVLTACASRPHSDQVPTAPFRIAVLPDQDREHLIARYAPVVDYLSESLGVRSELVVPDTYRHLIHLFGRREVDLAYFGGVSFVIAAREHRAQPLVMRNSDLRFTSYVLVRKDHPAETLQDLEGSSFAFGSRWSTSGHFMPRRFLVDQGLTPETHFGRILYSGQHDTTFRWVRDGKVDAGAANSKVIEEFFRYGEASRDQVRVLWESPPYVDYVWATQPSLGKTTSMRLRDTFLDLQLTREEHRPILQALDADFFLPADLSLFTALRQDLETLPQLSEIRG